MFQILNSSNENKGKCVELCTGSECNISQLENARFTYSEHHSNMPLNFQDDVST